MGCEDIWVGRGSCITLELLFSGCGALCLGIRPLAMSNALFHAVAERSGMAWLLPFLCYSLWFLFAVRALTACWPHHKRGKHLRSFHPHPPFPKHSPTHTHCQRAFTKNDLVELLGLSVFGLWNGKEQCLRAKIRQKDLNWSRFRKFFCLRKLIWFMVFILWKHY